MSLKGGAIQRHLESLRVSEPTRTRSAQPLTSGNPEPPRERSAPRRASRAPRAHVVDHTDGRIVFLLPWNGCPVEEAVSALEENPAVLAVEREQWSRRVDLRYDPAVGREEILAFIGRIAARRCGGG